MNPKFQQFANGSSEAYRQVSEQFSDTHRKITSKMGDNIAERVLAVFAYLLLAIGILASLYFAFDGIISHSISFEQLLRSGLCFIGGTLISILIWAQIMVIVNISNNLRQIKRNTTK